ncbi:MAG: TonB-dependent receptor [Pseudomonadota bacterium]
MKIRKIKRSLLAGSIITGFCAAPAMAQDGPDTSVDARDEIIVTSRFREESIQDVGASIRAFGQQELDDRGIEGIPELVRATPSLNVQERGPNRNEISIRGVTRFLTTQDLQPTPLPTGNYIDDVPINTVGGAQIDVRFYDLQRVEVLRGPQGTLFGEGALGGAIRYVTADPDLSEFGGSAEVELNSIQDGGVEGGARAAINVPLITDVVAIRLSGGRYAQDGYVDVVDGLDDVNDFEAYNFRGVLLAKPLEGLSVRLLGIVDYSDVGAFGAVTGDPERLETTQPLSNNLVEDDHYIVSGNVTYDLGDVAITSITSYVNRSRSRFIYDPISTASFSFFSTNPTLIASGLTGAPPTADPFLVDSFSTETLEYEQFSEELRFVSDFSGPLNFTAGVFYRDYTFKLTDADVQSEQLPLLPTGITVDLLTVPGVGDFRVPSPAGFFPSTSLSEGSALVASDPFAGNNLGNAGEQISGFVEFDYDVTDQLTLRAGVRYHNESIDVRQTASDFFLPSLSLGAFQLLDPSVLPDALAPLVLPQTVSGFAPLAEVDQTVELQTFLPKAAIEYQISDDILTYFQYSTGARNGNINAAVTLGFIESTLITTGLSPEEAAAAVDGLATYDEDRVATYELGFKSTFNDGDIVFNTSVFYNDYTDLQVIVLDPVIGLGYVDNVGSASTVGFEAEVFAQITDQFSVFAGGNYIDAQLESAIDQTPTNGDPSDAIPEGAPLPYTPDFTVSIGGEYVHPISDSLEAYISGDYSYTGEFTIGLSNGQAQDLGTLGKYGIAGLGVGIRDEDWSFDVRVSNITNNIEVVGTNFYDILVSGNGGVIPPGASLDENFVTQPRTIRATLRKSF